MEPDQRNQGILIDAEYIRSKFENNFSSSFIIIVLLKQFFFVIDSSVILIISDIWVLFEQGNDYFYMESTKKLGKFKK